VEGRLSALANASWTAATTSSRCRPRHPIRWPSHRARQRTLELAAERTKERLEFCRQLAFAIDHQRVQIDHQRVEIARLQEWLALVMASL